METSEKIASELRPLITRLLRKLRKLSPADGTFSQTERSVLVLLAQNGEMLSSELAVIEKITPQSMGQALNRLASMDLISKTISATDKRKVIISLSETGLKTLEKVRAERNEWLNQAITAVCTEEDKKALLAVIGPLTKIVDFN